MWGCGLKSGSAARSLDVLAIEILSRTKKLTIYDVTPYVGVWIEIREIAKQESRDKSPPMWGCGLKLYLLRKSR